MSGKPDSIIPTSQSRGEASPGSTGTMPDVSDFGPRLRSAVDSVSGAGEDVDLLSYIRVLYRRRWTVLTTFVVVILVFAVYVLTAVPVYEATARLLIEADKQNVVSFKQVGEEEDQPTDAFYQTQFKLLESPTLGEKTLDTLVLWNNEEFNSKPSAYQWLVSTLGAVVGRASPENDSQAAGEARHRSQVLDTYGSRLEVSPVKNSRLVDVRFRATSPDLAAKVANTHAKAFIERNLEIKFMASKEASDWLNEQLTQQRQKVEESEAAVQRYREQNDGVSLEGQENIVVQKLADLNAAVTRAKTERIEKEALYRQLEAIGPNAAALDTFPAILSNGFIQQLKTQLADLQRQRAQLARSLGELHPDMIKLTTAIQVAETKLQAEIAKVVLSVQNAYLAAETQERNLVQALEAQKREALAMNRKGIDGSVLKRDAESNRVLYDGLLQRAKETGVSGELKSSNIRLVDAAPVPRAPAAPKKAQLLLVALFGGALFGCGIALAFEYLDDRLKTPEDVSTHLRLSTLGLVPRVDPKELGPHPLISNGVSLHFSEAFRTVRTGVLFSSTETGATRVLVSSTVPGEGKTVTASNLAVGIALAGQRVLLIDTDMRRPQIHAMFGMEPEPGLSNLLVGNAVARDAIRLSSVPGLWVLPSGHLPPNPAELLASRSFRELLTSSSEQFDWLVIDAPPVMAVADASIVAQAVHGVVFVVGADMTSRRAAATAVDRIERANGRFFGVVMNHVNVQQHPYYYSSHYHRKNEEYYAAPNRA